MTTTQDKMTLSAKLGRMVLVYREALRSLESARKLRADAVTELAWFDNVIAERAAYVAKIERQIERITAELIA